MHIIVQVSQKVNTYNPKWVDIVLLVCYIVLVPKWDREEVKEMDKYKALGILATKGMSQRKLSDRLNVSKNTVNRWINNECAITDDKIIAMCNVLEIRDAQLIVDIFLPELSQNGTKERRNCHDRTVIL